MGMATRDANDPRELAGRRPGELLEHAMGRLGPPEHDDRETPCGHLVDFVRVHEAGLGLATARDLIAVTRATDAAERCVTAQATETLARRPEEAAPVPTGPAAAGRPMSISIGLATSGTS